jgi:hypothetical protein
MGSLQFSEAPSVAGSSGFGSGVARLGLTLGLRLFELLLNFDGSCGLLAEDFVLLEASPQLVKLVRVGLNVVGMVHNGQVLLVVATSLVGPVEGASHNEATVDNHELVMHVVRGSIVSAHSNAIFGQLNDVRALGL